MVAGVYKQYFVAIVHEVVVADVGSDIRLRPGGYGCGYDLAAAAAAQCYARYAYSAITKAVVGHFHAFAGEGGLGQCGKVFGLESCLYRAVHAASGVMIGIGGCHEVVGRTFVGVYLSYSGAYL